MNSEIIHNLEPIMSEVYKKTGISINDFKQTFLERRILYRMRTIGISSYEEYLHKLTSDIDEAGKLYAAFSINVTKFFRDPHVWKKLEEEILPKLMKDKKISLIQAWSCGSASGEEPHSIGILLDEFTKNEKTTFNIFATDINMEGINHSKKGIYKSINLENVSKNRIGIHFEKKDSGEFHVNDNIKKKIQYNKMDMMKSNKKFLDMIFCRNVLIYYPKEIHEKIYEKFYNSLKKDGILILGQDESMRGTKGEKFFKLLFPKERIYQKIN